MFLRNLLRNETQDGGIDTEEIEIYGGDAVLSRQYSSDHVVAYETELDQIEAEPTAVLALVVECLSQVLRANKIFAYQNFA
jgi:hypothetical protein